MTFLESFLAGEIRPEEFRHADHVRAGFELLTRHEFLEAATIYSRVLREITARDGKPEAFHLTVTLAFLSLIAERMEAQSHASFADFARANPDLMDRALLSRWYRPERLNAMAARRGFLLPDPAA